jgi:hypothetical protein
MLRIAYDPALVPPGGAQVVSECASPLSGRMTAEPAGRKFHEKCLKVRGLYGASTSFPLAHRIWFVRNVRDQRLEVFLQLSVA